MEILTSVRRLYICFKSLVNDFLYSFGRAALLLLVEVQNHTIPVRERRRIRVNFPSPTMFPKESFPFKVYENQAFLTYNTPKVTEAFRSLNSKIPLNYDKFRFLHHTRCTDALMHLCTDALMHVCTDALHLNCKDQMFIQRIQNKRTLWTELKVC